MDLRVFHQQWVKAREMQDLKEWRRLLFGAVAAWRELEKGLRVHRDVIRDRVNRLIAPGSTVLWNPNLWDRDFFLTKIEARPFKPQPATQRQPHQRGPGQGHSHSRHHSYAGPSNYKSPKSKRVVDLMVEAVDKLEVNVGFLHAVAMKKMKEERNTDANW